MHYKEKGEIAVFLAMLIGVMSMFMVILISGIKRNAYKSEITMAMDAAIRSCFAEYNERFFREYGIMCIDTSYKQQQQASIEELNNHLGIYLDENLKSSSGYTLGGLSVEDIEINKYKTIGDDLDSVLNVLRENDNVKSLLDGYQEDPDYYIDEKSISETEFLISDNRLIEIINEDMRENGSPLFDLAECITYFEVSVVISDTSGNWYNIVRSYGY